MGDGHKEQDVSAQTGLLINREGGGGGAQIAKPGYAHPAKTQATQGTT